MAVSQLNKMTAIDLARLIATRKVSPVEAVAAALDLVEETETQLNAFSQVDAEGARAAARRAEADVVSGNPLGPLRGLPISVKDLIDVKECGRHMALAPSRMRWHQQNSPAVERVRAAGATIIGKTTTSEFGYRGYTKSLVHGNTRNPGTWGGRPVGRAAAPPLRRSWCHCNRARD